MLLVIDIGNTQIALGMFSATDAGRKRRLISQWRISTHLHRTADEYGVLLLDLFTASRLTPDSIQGVALSSVVPPLTPVFTEMAEKYFGRIPLIISHETPMGIRIRYENPREVGADRLVNAVAAFSLYGGPAIIVDFGTATTFCAVTRRGEYLGGAIAPGISISAEALFSRAAKLPHVELTRPKSVMGKDTVSAIQAGVIFGYAGLVDELVRRIQREMPGGKDARVIATGGLAPLVAPECSTLHEVCPTLTLEGLRVIYDYVLRRS